MSVLKAARTIWIAVSMLLTSSCESVMQGLKTNIPVLSPPSAIHVPSVAWSDTIEVTYLPSDAAVTQYAKACRVADCSTDCLPAVQTLASPVTITSLVYGAGYFICMQSEDATGTRSGWVASSEKVTIVAKTQPSGNTGMIPVIEVVNEDIGTNCPYGGQKIITGYDDGLGVGTAANGKLDVDEVRSSVYVCSGATVAPGAKGRDGKSGTDGTMPLIKMLSEIAGPNCTYGGHRLMTGFDDGFGGGTPDNGQLDPEEARETSYVCSGAAGINGADGTMPLIAMANEPAGSNCVHGGQKISTGFDDGFGGGMAGNGQLDVTEVRSSAYACNGATGISGMTPLLTTSSEPAGPHCLNGGQKISTGFDDGYGGGTAGNGQLDALEVRSSAYACNGAAGANGTAGSNGLTPLVVAVAESAGINCTHGGQKINTGFDDGYGGGTAGNGQLDSPEVRSSAYVCNGATGGAGGGSTSLMATGTELPGTNCASGGLKITSGFDDGTGSGTAGNNLLEPGEVRSTNYVCNGLTDGASSGLTAAAAFELSWLEGFASVARTVTAAWTPASVQQSSFVNQIVGIYSDNLCTIQATAAQTLYTYGRSSTPVTLTADGTYYFKVATTMSGGTLLGSACSRYGIRIDTTAPSNATSLFWSQGTSSIRNNVEARWSRSVSSDLVDQDLLLYSGTSCDTLVQTMTNLGSSLTSQVLITPSTGNYGFKIRSFDSLRNASISACSSAILINSVEQLTISGVPTGTSFLTDISITVTSNNPDFAAYAYALVSNSSVCPSSGYSNWYSSSTVTALNLASLADGPVRLCVISKDSLGNQMSTTMANSVEWTKSSVASGFSILPTKHALRLSWNPAGGGIVGYLVIRRKAAAVSWAPVNGITYTLSEPDTDHTIVFDSIPGGFSKITISDTGLTNNLNYFYRLYGYDASRNYTEIGTASGIPYAAGNSCTILAPPTTSAVCTNDPSNKSVSQNFAGGAGSAISPYVICNGNQLSNIRNYLAGKYFVLGDNIDMTNFGTWTSIASGFTGNFDGKDFHISNLSTAGAGLFTATSANAVLQNFVMKNSTINAPAVDNVGSVVGLATGTLFSNIINCNTVSGRNYVGGIVGQASNNSKFWSVINDGPVTANTALAGGLVGYVNTGSSIGYGSNYGIISSQGPAAGGIAAYGIAGSFTNLLNTGTINAATRSAGIVGYAEATSVLYAQNQGEITSTTQEAAGIIAYSNLVGSSNVIKKCLNFGRIVTTGMYGGGIVGFSHTTSVTYNSNYGVISGTSFIGGVAGLATRGTLTNLTNSGAVTSSGNNAGGIIGGSGDNADLNLATLSNSGSVVGVSYVGGIIGFGSDVGVNQATNSGSVTASGNHAGGIFGQQAWYDNCNVNGPLSNLSNSGVIRGVNNVGGIAGQLCPGGVTITNASNSSSGEVYGSSYVGGILGRTNDNGDNSLSNVTNSAKITGTGNYVGGIAGFGSDLISLISASNSGAVSGASWVGGIVGEHRFWDSQNLTINGASNSGPVSGLDYVAGIHGAGPHAGFKYLNCSNLASATITGRDYVAGIVGYMGVNFGPTLSNNQNSALISGRSYVAGIIGRGSDVVTLDSNANYGTVLGTSDYVGGVAALIERWDNNNITYSGNVNAGQVSGSNYVAGIIGYHNAYGHHLSSSINSGNITGNNYVAGIVGVSLSNGDYALSTATNSGAISGVDYVAGIIGSGSDLYTSNTWQNSGSITGRNYVAGGIGSLIKFDVAQQTFSAFTNTGNVQGVSYTAGIFGYLENAIVTTALNTGNISGDRSNINNRFTGGIAGQVTGVRCTTCTNSGIVNGNDSVGGITGGLSNNIASTQAWSGLANAGAIRGLTNVGGIYGQVNLANAVTTNQVVNYYAEVSAECTSACGPIVGQHLAGTNTMTSVYSVAQTSAVSNVLGTKVDMALSSFNMSANFLGAPPSGTAFNLAVWDYLLSMNSQVSLAWPKSGFP